MTNIEQLRGMVPVVSSVGEILYANSNTVNISGKPVTARSEALQGLIPKASRQVWKRH